MCLASNDMSLVHMKSILMQLYLETHEVIVL